MVYEGGGVEKQLLNVLEEHKRPMTAAEIAHRLNLSLEKVVESVSTLKACGELRETRIEDLMREEK